IARMIRSVCMVTASLPTDWSGRGRGDWRWSHRGFAEVGPELVEPAIVAGGTGCHERIDGSPDQFGLRWAAALGTPVQARCLAGPEGNAHPARRWGRHLRASLRNELKGLLLRL